MHKPKVHKVLNLVNDFRNSTILSNKSNFDETRNNIEKNLDIISSGPVPPNPSELVLSEKVKDLIFYAEKNYDYLFFDTLQ